MCCQARPRRTPRPRLRSPSPTPPADTATSGQLTLYAGNGGTEPFSLNMTSGSWTVLSTPPGTSQPFPAQTTTTLTGTVAPLTGAITDATLTLPVQDNVCSAAAGGMHQLPHGRGRPGHGHRFDQLQRRHHAQRQPLLHPRRHHAGHRPVPVDPDQHDLPVHCALQHQHRRRDALGVRTTTSPTSPACTRTVPVA